MIVAAGEFKAKCLRLMDTVRDTGEEIVITKHGKPVAKLVSPTKKRPRSLYGCMKGAVTYCGDIISPIDVKKARPQRYRTGGSADQNRMPAQSAT